MIDQVESGSRTSNEVTNLTDPLCAGWSTAMGRALAEQPVSYALELFAGEAGRRTISTVVIGFTALRWHGDFVALGWRTGSSWLVGIRIQRFSYFVRSRCVIGGCVECKLIVG